MIGNPIKPNLHVKLSVLKTITSLTCWKRDDLPDEESKKIASFLGSENTFGVLISGTLDPSLYRGNNTIIAGFDRIRIENNPKPNEPDLNVDHFVVGVPDENEWCPVYGPYKEGGHLPHWCEEEDIHKIKLGEESIEGNDETK